MLNFILYNNLNYRSWKIIAGIKLIKLKVSFTSNIQFIQVCL